MTLEVRALAAPDLEALHRDLPSWSSANYPSRLEAQALGELVQVFAWDADLPVGRGMARFAGLEERSESAIREGCAEVRDVFVTSSHRRRGAATAIMSALEDASRGAGWRRIGLSVSLDDEAAPARALYTRLGYRHAHGPYVTSATLDTDDGPLHVHAIMVYLVKEL
ncbi:MAG TPA: GNAT family N-acetyltransferase [Actinomycetota bacterium]|nr:GNAT family N-acetyltransferase [Actinomycetota bacterium]